MYQRKIADHFNSETEEECHMGKSDFHCVFFEKLANDISDERDHNCFFILLWELIPNSLARGGGELLQKLIWYLSYPNLAFFFENGNLTLLQ